MLGRSEHIHVYPDVSLSPHLLFGFQSLPDSLEPLSRGISNTVHKNLLTHYQGQHGHDQSLHCQ